MYQFDLLALDPQTEDPKPEDQEVLVVEDTPAMEDLGTPEGDGGAQNNADSTDDPNTDNTDNDDTDNEAEGDTEATEESLEVILHDQANIAAEMESDKAEFKALLSSFRELNEIKVSIEQYGIDDRLIALVGDELDTISASFKTRDAETTLEEIEAATEGIVEYIKEKASNFAARWKNGWLKYVRSDGAIKQKLRGQLAKIDKMEAPGLIGSKKIVARTYDTADVTIPIVEKVILNSVVMPKYEAGKDSITAWVDQQLKHVEQFNLDQDKCVLKFRGDYQYYESDPSYKPIAMSVEESGIQSVDDVKKYGQMVLNSHFGERKMENTFNKQWDEIMEALRTMPIGETDAIYELYDRCTEAIYTAFIECDSILRQYAVQTLIVSQGVA